jgi:hypothetical protein
MSKKIEEKVKLMYPLTVNSFLKSTILHDLRFIFLRETSSVSIEKNDFKHDKIVPVSLTLACKWAGEFYLLN